MSKFKIEIETESVEELSRIVLALESKEEAKDEIVKETTEIQKPKKKTRKAKEEIDNEPSIEIATETIKVESNTIENPTVITETKPAEQVIPTAQLVNVGPLTPNVPAMAAVANTPVQNTIPTTQVVTNYTQDQIAGAMAMAMQLQHINPLKLSNGEVIATGMELVHKVILAQYGAQSLMDIDPKNYGQIAIILNQAGVKV